MAKRTLTHDEVAALAESVGLPGETFAQIAKGESGYQVGVQGHDPGGTTGLGLWQITTKFNDDIIKKYGGAQRLLTDPVANAKAAKAIYDRQGIGAWYGTKYVTGNNLHYKGSTPPPAGLPSAAPSSSTPSAASPPSLLGDPGQAGDFTGLLGQLLAKPEAQPVQAMSVAPPQFSAQPALPQGFHAPTPELQQAGAQGSGVDGALSLLQTLGRTDPSSAPASAAADATGGAQDTVVGKVTKERAAAKTATGLISPNARPGDPVVSGKQSVGGEHETAGLAGYPAHDFFAPAGTHAVAPISGTVVRLSGHDPADGPTNGPHGPLGYSVYIKGSDGRTYFLTHLGSRNVKPGQKLAQGQIIGTVADYDKYGTPSHVHMGVSG